MVITGIVAVAIVAVAYMLGLFAVQYTLATFGVDITILQAAVGLFALRIIGATWYGKA